MSRLRPSRARRARGAGERHDEHDPRRAGRGEETEEAGHEGPSLDFGVSRLSRYEKGSPIARRVPVMEASDFFLHPPHLSAAFPWHPRGVRPRSCATCSRPARRSRSRCSASSRSTPRVLDAMGHLVMSGPLSPGELSRRLDLTTAASTDAIDRLVDLGHVTRTPHPTERRSVLVVPTDAFDGARDGPPHADDRGRRRVCSTTSARRSRWSSPVTSSAWSTLRPPRRWTAPIDGDTRTTTEAGRPSRAAGARLSRSASTPGGGRPSRAAGARLSRSASTPAAGARPARPALAAPRSAPRAAHPAPTPGDGGRPTHPRAGC